MLNKATPQDALLFEAKMIINPKLKFKVMWQKQTLNLVQQYGRKTLRAEIEAVHQKLFTLPQHQSFRQRVMQLFTKR